MHRHRCAASSSPSARCNGASHRPLFATLFAALLAALTLSAPLQAQPRPAPPFSAPREFGDWTVACDNGGRCEAISVSQQRAQAVETEWGEASLFVLRVVRDGDADSRPRIFVDRRLWGAVPNDTTPLTLHVLHDRSEDSTGRGYRLTPLSNGQHELDPRDVAAFLAEARGSQAVATRRAGDPRGDVRGLSSTDGMAAALHRMDEIQGRLGTPTAIYAPTRLVSHTVSPPAPLPTVSVVSLAAGDSVRDASDAELAHYGAVFCGVAAPPLGATVYLLANGDLIWHLDCPNPAASGDAPAAIAVWFATKAGSEEFFPVFQQHEIGQRPILATLPNVGFVGASGVLTATHHDAINGDCGWQRSWGWTGTDWQLVESRELHACMGVMPEGWLVTWRTERR